MKNYVRKHIESGAYRSDMMHSAYVYTNSKGWKDYIIGETLLFSHRDNTYTNETFAEGLHNHKYYELIVYISGDVEYVCENEVSVPKVGMIIACAPDVMHTTRLLAGGPYERYMLYFKREFFSFNGEQLPLPGILSDPKGHSTFQPDEIMLEKIRSLLNAAEEAGNQNSAAGCALAHSYIVQFFSLIDGSVGGSSNTRLPENVARIKNYIDTYYSSIEGVSEIASYFFYSREHASRLFRQYFNITLSDYLMQRRVAESTKLLIEGSGVADACYSVGFRSVSSYINAFRRVTGCLPSEYKKKKH